MKSALELFLITAKNFHPFFTPFEFIRGQVFSAVEHAPAEEVGETNQILSSRHQRPQPHIPSIPN